MGILTTFEYLFEPSPCLGKFTMFELVIRGFFAKECIPGVIRVSKKRVKDMVGCSTEGGRDQKWSIFQEENYLLQEFAKKSL